jgi:thioredoxin reductase
MSEPRSSLRPVGAETLPTEHARVVVIGAGPAGLAAAARLAGSVGGEVRVLDREAQPGGIPRHSDHTGYGLRDLRRVMTGPDYARRLVEQAERAGAVLCMETMVTGWAGGTTMEVTAPGGRCLLRAEAVILATGARERPRTARLIPGDRAAGVYTTGQLQNLVHLHQAHPGRRAVVVGAELVSWSAVLTLRAGGCRTVLMTSRHERPESYAAVTLAGRLGLRTPVATRTRVARINGRGRVRSVEIENLDTGRRRTIECDTVVTTGDWIPDSELARDAGLGLDAATRGPLVDTALRTSLPGVFAAGNVVHPVDTADVAALDGRHVAEQVRRRLAAMSEPPAAAVRLVAERPLLWVTPQLLRRGDPAPARNRLLLWTDALVRLPVVEVIQDGVVLTRRRLPWPAAPGRAFRVPADVLARVQPDAGEVTIRLAAGWRR